MQKIALTVLKFLEKISGKRFIYIPKSRKAAGKTAVKADEGFWYVGDITDTHDLAYGVLYNGIVEKEETGLVKRALQKMLGQKSSLVFFDIGANTGYYGIMAAFLGSGTVKTYSFEPLPDCKWSIEQSAQLNRLEDKIKVFPVALGDKPGMATLFVSGSGSTLNKDFLDQADAPQQTIKVETLDNMVAQNQLPGPDFIKMDVEGNELQVLEGARSTVSNYQPVMFIEIAKTLKNIGRGFVNPNYEKTFDLLESWGYKVFCQEGPRLIPADKRYYSDGVHMFFCVPSKMQETLKDVTHR